MPRLVLIIAGGLLTLLSAWGWGRLVWRRKPPSEVLALASGSVALSLLIYLAVLLKLPLRAVFAGLGCVGCLGLAGIRRPRLRPVHWVLWIVPVFGVYYLIHALTPEIQPDGVTYHLGLVREWLSLGRFPDRIGFYEMLPQGMEMLFGFAFTMGEYSAAKLVSFGFLLASLALIVQMGQKLGLNSAPAAVMYFVTPVVAISGTCSYTDASFVFFLLAAFLLLLHAADERPAETAFHAGLAAGFCYAIKMSGLLLPPLLVFIPLFRRQWKATAWFAAGAAVSILPWMIRSVVLTGNPLAPLMNGLFPNDFFHYGSEKFLSSTLRDYGGISWSAVPADLLFHGRNLQGLIGPAYLLAPLAVWSVRRMAGRWLLVMALVAGLPWVLNRGTRFLVPALPFIAAAIPAPIAAPLAVVHAGLSLPPILEFYTAPSSWRLKGFPWQAALRLQPEADYLRLKLWEYRICEVLTRHVRPGEKVLDLFGVPYAYTPVVPVGSLPSAEFDNFADTLALGALAKPDALYELRASLTASPISALRVQLVMPPKDRWSINEVRFHAGGQDLPPSTSWRLSGSPNPGDAPLAFDLNLATRWQTWDTALAGQFIEVNFPVPLTANEVSAVFLQSERNASARLRVKSPSGDWTTLTPIRSRVESEALRWSATQFLRRSGIQWIVASSNGEGHGVTGKSMRDSPPSWNVDLVEQAGDVCLFRVR